MCFFLCAAPAAEVLEGPIVITGPSSGIGYGREFLNGLETRGEVTVIAASGSGVYVGNTGLTSAGSLTLMKGGSAPAVYVRLGGVVFAPGSLLELAGGGIALNNSNANNANIQTGARLVSLEAGAIAPGQILARDVIMGGNNNTYTGTFLFGPSATLRLASQGVVNNNYRVELAAEGLYHSGSLSAENSRYEDADVRFGGLSMGAAKNFGPLTAGIAGHYINGRMDASSYDSVYQGLGLTLGLGRAFALAESLNLWTELHGGYARYSFTQRRSDWFGAETDSNPEVDVWSVGLLASLDVALGENLTLTPYLGLDYAYLNMHEYTESGNFYALKVKPDDYNSLLGSVGLAVTWRAPEQVARGLSLAVRGEYAHEFADVKAEVASRMLSYQDMFFITRGQNAERGSGSVGGGVFWRPNEVFSLGVDYDYRMADSYDGHEMRAMI